MLSDIESRDLNRKREIGGIYYSLISRLDSERINGHEEMEAYATIMIGTPKIIDSQIKRSCLTEEQFYCKGLKAFEFELKREYLLRFLNALKWACNQNPRSTNEVSIDSFYIAISQYVTHSFDPYQQLLAEAEFKGRNGAVNTLLTAVERERIPLFRYKRNLAEIMAGSQRTPNGELFYTLPTRIDTINLTLRYLGHQIWPEMSLVVNPLL